MARSDSSRTDTARDRGDDGERTAVRQWYCYLGLRLRLQQGELFDFRAAISGDA